MTLLLFASCIEQDVVAVVKNSDIIMSLNDSQHIKKKKLWRFLGSVGSIKCLIKTQQMLRIFIIVVCGVKKAILCDTFACYKIGGTAHRA